MTIGTLAPFATASPAQGSGRGARFVELLLVGGATFFLFPLAWLLRRAIGGDAADYAVGFTTFYGAYLVNDPHFAVTYLLFYKDARGRALDPARSIASRVRYVLAGLFVPVLLAAWAIAALVARSASSLGAMIQLMYLLVGWHYAKQGFGVANVLAARRGPPFAARERVALLTQAYAGWAYAWGTPVNGGGDFEEHGVVYRAIAHPRWFAMASGAVLVASTVWLVVVLAAKWRREGARFPLGPIAIFLVTIWSWTIYSTLDPLVQYVIPALHSLQYLYVVWLLRRNQARAEREPPTFGAPVVARLAWLAASSLALGWLLFHGGPSFLDGAFGPQGRHRLVDLDAMGPTPCFAALFVVVSVHHYVMDAVIWRRDNPDTKWLRAG